MTDLVAFLRARLDEDHAEIEKHPDGEDGGYEGLTAGREQGYPGESYLRIGKARALAEVEAKRRIAQAHEKWCAGDCEADAIGPDATAYPLDGAYFWAMKLFAAVYADHPDYDPAWRPA